jgi:hypothetical protein
LLVAFSEAGVGFEAMGSFTADNELAKSASRKLTSLLKNRVR